MSCLVPVRFKITIVGSVNIGFVNFSGIMLLIYVAPFYENYQL